MRKIQPNIYMLTGHAYARVLRAHIMFSVASLVSHMLDASDNLIETGLNSLETIHDMLLNNDFPNENIVYEQAVDQLTKILDDLAEELTLKRRTGKSWI